MSPKIYLISHNPKVIFGRFLWENSQKRYNEWRLKLGRNKEIKMNKVKGYRSILL